MTQHHDVGMAAFYRLLPGGVMEDSTTAGIDGLVVSDPSDGMMSNNRVGVVALVVAVVFLFVA